MENAEYILKALIENLQEGIHIVDNEGKTIYYNNSMGEVEGLKPSEVLGKKVNEYLKGVEDNSSTLMNVLKNKKKIMDVVQRYKGKNNKSITTINTTIPVIKEGKVIGAVEISKDMTVLRELNEKVCMLQDPNPRYSKNFSFSDISGNTEGIKKAIEKAKKASKTSASVLIYGETGCGKEIFAQSIHYGGIRKDKPFIAINCAAIPHLLLEGMLFGTVKGSFTGAENKKGLFEEATGGTILLDEVNSMEPSLQSKLLRVLQDGYIRPVGSSKLVDIDVRIIASLNDEPEKLMEEGKLRKDFYYRLSVIRINIPPLRERKEDINILIESFISYYNKILNKEIKYIDNEVLESFLSYQWPGNIRELKNVIESAMILSDNESILTKEYFDYRIMKIHDLEKIKLQEVMESEKEIKSKEMENVIELKKEKNDCIKDALKYMSLEVYLDNVEKQFIVDALNENNYNISEASRALKMSRQNIQHKMKKYGLEKNKK